MGLDIRWPIGVMFTLISVLLIIEGMLTAPIQQTVGININLIWGVVLLVFGVLMLLLGASRAAAKHRHRLGLRGLKIFIWS